MNAAPVEGKVAAATVGSGAGAVVSVFILWLLGVLVFGASGDATLSSAAIEAVPTPVAGLIGAAVTVGGTFVGGYFAQHTPRIENIVDQLAVSGAFPAPVPGDALPVEPVEPAELDAEEA